MNNVAILSLLGALFLTLEAFGIAGVGCLFAGLAFISLAALIKFDIITDPTIISQIGLLFGLTAIWASILWMPLKKYRSKKTPYQNIVGSIATITSSPLIKGKNGTISWSGTIMSAKLDNNSKEDSLQIGTNVIITAVEGSTVIVKNSD